MKKNKKIIIILIIFFIVSIISIYGTLKYVSDSNIIYKQIFFYLLGFLIILLLTKFDYQLIVEYGYIFYIVINILLALVLFIGEPVNGARAWFKIPKIGTFQPSEFMKIGLILMNAKIIDSHNKKYNNNFINNLKLIIKLLIITIIPSILTFLEPDTGAVILYMVILIGMLYISGIKRYWFYISITILLLTVGGILYLYLFQQEYFINILGSDFFYRMDRIFDWINGKGMQLENSLIAIGSSGILGKGFNKILIYFPEPATDFIFASFASCFGLIGALFLITTIIMFDLEIINIAKKTNIRFSKYIIIGILCSLIYQQIQNIGMTIGLFPITGITLPFISYGGSSLLSYMILIGIIININKKEKMPKHFNTL